MTKKSVGQKKFRYGKNVPNSPKQLEPVGNICLRPKILSFCKMCFKSGALEIMPKTF